MKGLMLFANGMEDSETLVTLSLLRKIKVEMVCAALEDTLDITTLDGLDVKANVMISDVNLDDFDFLIIPGGRFCKPRSLIKDDPIKKIALHFAKKGQLIAAICHAPTLLDSTGILDDKEFVCHPSVRDMIVNGKYVGPKKAHTNKNLITAEAAGSPVEFTYEIVKYLFDQAVADALMARIRY